MPNNHRDCRCFGGLPLTLPLVHSTQIVLEIQLFAEQHRGRLEADTVDPRCHSICICRFTYSLKCICPPKSILQVLSESPVDRWQGYKMGVAQRARSQLRSDKVALCRPASALTLCTRDLFMVYSVPLFFVFVLPVSDFTVYSGPQCRGEGLAAVPECRKAGMGLTEKARGSDQLLLGVSSGHAFGANASTDTYFKRCL